MSGQLREVRAGQNAFQLQGQAATAQIRGKFGRQLARKAQGAGQVGVNILHQFAAVFGLVAHDVEGIVAVMGHCPGGLFQRVAGHGHAAAHGERDDARALGEKTLVIGLKAVFAFGVELHQPEGRAVVALAQHKGQARAVALLVDQAVKRTAAALQPLKVVGNHVARMPVHDGAHDRVATQVFIQIGGDNGNALPMHMAGRARHPLASGISEAADIHFRMQGVNQNFRALAQHFIRRGHVIGNAQQVVGNTQQGFRVALHGGHRGKQMQQAAPAFERHAAHIGAIA